MLGKQVTAGAEFGVPDQSSSASGFLLLEATSRHNNTLQHHIPTLAFPTLQHWHFKGKI